MSIRFACPSCGRLLEVKDQHAGKRVKCPSCGAAVIVPTAGAGRGLEAPSPRRGPGPFTVEHNLALEVLKQHGSTKADKLTPEQQRIFADLAAAGLARKEGNAYVRRSNGLVASLKSIWNAVLPTKKAPTPPKIQHAPAQADHDYWNSVRLTAFVLTAAVLFILGGTALLISLLPKRAAEEALRKPAEVAAPLLRDGKRGNDQPPPMPDWAVKALLRPAPAQAEEKSKAPDPAPLSAEAIFARASPAVVEVLIQDRQGRTIASGSGFLVSPKGLIATNYHVIEKAHKAHVVLADKAELSVVGVAALDEEADIAIMKVADSISAKPLELAGADLPPVGAKVYAIGNPLGFHHTLSGGQISAHRERGTIPHFPRMPMMIQTDASISKGSSGGPLLGEDGKVVGITTLSWAFEGGQNINFAVPVANISRLLRQCEDQGRLTQFPLARQPDSYSKREIPPDAFFFASRGQERLSKKDYNGAIQDFSEAIRLNPNYAYAYRSRGLAWHCKKDYDRAIEDFNEAIRLDPKDALAYRCRGLAWDCKRDHDRAIEDFNEAIRLDPKDALAYGCRGWALLVKKDYDRAIEDFDEAIRLDPDLEPAHKGRDLGRSFKNGTKNFLK